MSDLRIYQIFYDAYTRDALDGGFFPLDNTIPQLPGWFEFGAIRTFLKANALKDDAWYGFLSPRFPLKTGLSSRDVISLLRNAERKTDVYLFCPDWDQMAFFRNPYEQLDFWHPGTLTAAQRFFDSANILLDLHTLVTSIFTSVTCNYVIAKKRYWEKWLRIADIFLRYCNSPTQYEFNELSTLYRGSEVPIKVFIQEHFPTIILKSGAFKVQHIDMRNMPVFERLFATDQTTRDNLIRCHALKRAYELTPHDMYLDEYYRIRRDITLKAV